MAFGLTAASAAVTAFTINTVEEVPGTDSATKLISTGSCTGTYDVTFTQDQYGYTTGGAATRTAPPAPDDNLQFCANTPAYVELYAPGGSQYEYTSWYGNTDADGDIAFDFTSNPGVSSVIADSGWEIKITIGPEAGYGPL